MVTMSSTFHSSTSMKRGERGVRRRILVGAKKEMLEVGY